MQEPYLEFEVKFAEFMEQSPGQIVGCSSGTAALHLALECLQLPVGSRVAVPDYCMVSCARAIVLAGLTPVFVDIDPVTLLLDIDKVPDDVKAVLAVHTFGRLLDVDRLVNLGLPVIEDMAELHGASPNYNSAAACWSFYKNKVIAGEEGGAVWFSDANHAYTARSLRSVGMTEAHDYTHIPRGHNYRLSNAHASLIMLSLMRYNLNVAERRTYELMCDNLCPEEFRMPRRVCPWVYDLRVPGMKLVQQRKLITELRSIGILARYGFRPMTSQAEFHGHLRTPNSDKAWTEVIYLPLERGVKYADAFDIIYSHAHRPSSK